MEDQQLPAEKLATLSDYELAIERTRLANDRTMLSFIRTSLYFGVAGLTIDNLLKLSFGRLIDIFFWIIAIVNLVLGVVSYYRLKKKLKSARTNKDHLATMMQDED